MDAIATRNGELGDAPDHPSIPPAPPIPAGLVSNDRGAEILAAIRNITNSRVELLRETASSHDKLPWSTENAQQEMNERRRTIRAR